MKPSSRDALPTLELSRSELPQALFEELCSAVRGPVFRPSDSDFAERSRTFNGKLVCLSKALVSPLDAQDVSAVVCFCSKHNLSPSVKAGGYATAGWSVAGDVIIDLGMLRECEIEPPLPEDEVLDGKDWVRLRDMLVLGNKGKGRADKSGIAGSVRVQASAPLSVDMSTSGLQPRVPSGIKRRRDSSEEPEEDTLPKLKASQEKRNLLRSYDDASGSVASFLHGPALPSEEGEESRKPPTNRRRYHSPEISASESSAMFERPQPAEEGYLQPPKMEARTDSSESSTLDSASGSGFGSRTTISQQSTTATTPEAMPDVPETADTPAKTATQEREADPFSYLLSGRAPELRAPMFSAANPFNSSTSLGPIPPEVLAAMNGAETMFAAMGRGMGMSSWTTPPSASIGTQGVWGAGAGPSSSMYAGLPIGTMSVPGFSFPAGQLGMGAGTSMGIGPFTAPVPSQMAPAQPVHKHAYVTLGAGMRQKEVDVYTAEHPLEGLSGVTGGREPGLVPYHIPSSAHPVGSSILLLAGFGFISRMRGLSIDNLVEVEMVLADGRIVIVNEEEDPDLWWAVRGAGPAFGIATRYKVRAFPVPVVFAGNLIYRFHRATAPSLIKHFRDCVKNAPRELYANVLLTAGPADKDSLVVIQMCYVGPKEKGVEYLNAISSWDGERCLLNEVSEKSYLTQQDSVAQILRGKAGRQWFIRSSLIHSLPDEVVNKTVIQFANTPIGCTWIFELSGGAIADFDDTCLPKEQREAIWTVAALHQWEMGIDDPRCITSAEEWIDATIGTVALGGPYPSFLGRHEPPSRTKASYGKNWDRLAELKRKFDPECLFKNNLWPVNKLGEPIEFLANEPPSP